MSDPRNTEQIPAIGAYWSRPVAELCAALDSSPEGLDSANARERLQRYGANSLQAAHPHSGRLRLFVERFRNPLVLILVFAAAVSMIVHDWLDTAIILTIVLITAVTSFVQEYRASAAVEKLRQRVSVRSTVLRDGQELLVPSESVVPGDVVRLVAGSLIPADGVLLDARDFHVSQALLTGEPFPVEKQPGSVSADASLSERSNCVFMGTSVRSGTATALIVQTGTASHYGRIADTLALRPPEAEFERGLRQFGTLLFRIMVFIVLAVLALNVVLQHPRLEMLLFAMALAVGLSPELLPVILTVTLSRGAQNMAREGVIVKRLNAIENLGSMDVLCTDKTGTLTRGVVQLDSAMDVHGQESATVLRLAYLNSRFETGLVNPLDAAVIAAGERLGIDCANDSKLDEIPYDFVRKRLSIVVKTDAQAPGRMITKGALENVLDVCDRHRAGDAVLPLEQAQREQIRERFVAWSAQGFRVLGVAEKLLDRSGPYTRDDECSMVFAGFLLFFDPPEAGVRETLDGLRRLGVQLKIITGDNRLVAQHVAAAVGIDVRQIVTGAEMASMHDEALWNLAPQVALFAEVDPNQKERIITALQKTGHVVGYLGDGINDAPALHAADVGISVDQAADVAKDAADFVLLQHDLEAVRKGIDEGRHTFANTLKYIFITTSANFGNMVSMALGTLFLPFLPLLAKQILLNNLLSAVPAMGIASDRVDRDWEATPHRWDIRMIRNFMLTFGLLSTAFDLLTFGALLYLAGEAVAIFRTGWFVESLLTQLLIMLVIRTHGPLYRSMPGRFLLWATLAVACLTMTLPWLPVHVFDFVPLPLPILGAVLLITVLYLLVSEATKRTFYRRWV